MPSYISAASCENPIISMSGEKSIYCKCVLYQNAPINTSININAICTIRIIIFPRCNHLSFTTISRNMNNIESTNAITQFNHLGEVVTYDCVSMVWSACAWMMMPGFRPPVGVEYISLMLAVSPINTARLLRTFVMYASSLPYKISCADMMGMLMDEKCIVSIGYLVVVGCDICRLQQF